jgi:hypothetical protein
MKKLLSLLIIGAFSSVSFAQSGAEVAVGAEIGSASSVAGGGLAGGLSSTAAAIGVSTGTLIVGGVVAVAAVGAGIANNNKNNGTPGTTGTTGTRN